MSCCSIGSRGVPLSVSLFSFEGDTGSWVVETTVNCVSQATLGAVAGSCLACPVAGAVCGGSYALFKSGLSGLAEAVHFIRLEQAKIEEDSFFRDTANKIAGVFLSVVVLPLLPFLLCIHLISAVARTSLRLAHDQCTAWLSMGIVYAGAVSASVISAPSAVLLACSATWVDLCQDSLMGTGRINRVFAQSFNEVAQGLYPYPLNRMITISY